MSDDRIAEIYRTHNKTIRTRIQRGRIKTMYHFLVPATKSLSQSDLKQQLESIYHDYDSEFKINVSFGIILRYVPTDELRFFYPSYNANIFELPKRIKNLEDIKPLLEDLDHEDRLSYAKNSFPTSAWCFEKICCVRYDTYRMRDN